MKSIRRAIIPACIAGLSLFATACGGTDDPSGTTAATDEEVATTNADAGTSKDAENADGIPQDLIEAAQAEGEVVLYHGTGETQTQEWVQAFTEKYDIQVVQHRDSSNPLWERFAQETRAGQHFADVVIINNTAQWEQGISDEWIAEYTPQAGSQHEADLKREGFYYPLYASMHAIGYNTNEVTDEEEASLQENALEALTDPVWDGRIAAATPLGSLHTTAQWYMIGNQMPEYGQEWLDAVGDNSPVMYDSSVPMSERLVAGEHAVTFANPDSLLGPSYGDGAPIRWAYPKEKTVGMVWHVGLSANASNTSAGQLFMEWATTVEANEGLAEATLGRPMHPDAEDPRPFIGEDWFSEPDELWTTWATDEQFADDKESFLETWEQSAS